MKHFGKMIFGAAMIASFASCTNETDFGQGAAGQVEEGIPTYARITLNVNQMGSRAPQNTTPSLDFEKDLQGGVRIFVFDKNGVLEADQTFTEQQLTDDPTSAGHKKTAVIATKTGLKTIYAIANPGLLGANDLPKNLGDFKNYKFTAVTQGAPGEKPEVKVAEVNKFFMTGFKEETLTKSDKTNPVNVKINVTRLAAKAALALKDGANQTGVNFKPVKTAVTASDAKFQLVQMNKESKIYVAEGEFSPMGSKAEQATAKHRTGVLTYAHLTTQDWQRSTIVDAWTNALATSDFTTATTKEKFAYTSENINESPEVGNVTFAMIQMKLKPTKFSSEEGTFDTATGTFFAVVQYAGAGTTKADQIIAYHGIYKDEATANKAKQNLTAAGTTNCEIIKYENGISYYRLNLRDKAIENNIINRYAVKRNHYFKITVDAINNPGVNKAEDLFPNTPVTPVEEDAFIDATIEVDDWIDVDMTESLG